MRSRHLCTNEEYLRGDDADIKIALKNEIPELMAEIELRISSLGPLSKNLQKNKSKNTTVLIQVENVDTCVLVFVQGT